MAGEYNITNKYLNLVNSVGKGVLNALYPRDIEFYFISLELTDSDNNTIDYFTFPVMPEGISRNQNKRINIKQALNSTTVLTSSSFVPFDVNLRGDFGRVFKIMLSGESVIFSALRYSMLSGVNRKDQISDITLKEFGIPFDPAIKSGYGCSKILQSIIDKSDGSDGNGNFKLYLYLPAFGESYLVVPTQNPLTWTQNVTAKNMIWQYNLNLKAIAPISSLRDEKELRKKMVYVNSFSSIEKGVNNVSKTIAKMIVQ